MIGRNKLLEDIERKLPPENFGEKCAPLDVIYAVLQVINEQPEAS